MQNSKISGICKNALLLGPPANPKEFYLIIQLPLNLLIEWGVGFLQDALSMKINPHKLKSFGGKQNKQKNQDLLLAEEKVVWYVHVVVVCAWLPQFLWFAHVLKDS